MTAYVSCHVIYTVCFLFIQLMKMTFKKKDPELVTLYFVSPDLPDGKARQYRVSKRQEFVNALQKNMERFK